MAVAAVRAVAGVRAITPVRAVGPVRAVADHGVRPFCNLLCITNAQEPKNMRNNIA